MPVLLAFGTFLESSSKCAAVWREVMSGNHRLWARLAEETGKGICMGEEPQVHHL